MKSIPLSKGKANPEDQEQVVKMMESMGSLMGILEEEVTADKRGLVVNYHLLY